MPRLNATISYCGMDYALLVTLSADGVEALHLAEPAKAPVELTERVAALSSLAGTSPWDAVMVLGEGSPRFDFIVRAVNAAVMARGLTHG